MQEYPKNTKKQVMHKLKIKTHKFHYKVATEIQHKGQSGDTCFEMRQNKI